MEVNVQLRDEEAEKIVLGTIIAERDAIEMVRDILTEECFYNPLHAEIYKAVLQVVSSGNRADLVFVKGKLEENGVKFDIVEYMNIVSCHTFDLYQYASRLQDLHIRRKFYSIGQYLVSNSYTEAEDIEDVAKRVNEDMASLFNRAVPPFLR